MRKWDSMMKRRYYKSRFEQFEKRRKEVLRKYRDNEYIEPERTVLDILTLFLPVFEDSIEEEAWSICYGDDADNEAKRIVKDIKKDITLFLCRYEAQLNKIASEDPIQKIQDSLDNKKNDCK